MKNKAFAPIQITAEQLLREATERLDETAGGQKKKTYLEKGQTSNEYRLNQRTQFEDAIRRNRTMMGTWIKYARFEEGQGEPARARSVYERALDVEPRNQVLWLKYAEFEMAQGNVNMARNIWDRALTILPRVDQFWYKYAYMEERLGNVEGARAIFERWMSWEPEEAIWMTFVKFEKRQQAYDKARFVFERMLVVHPTLTGWLRYAKFEEEEAKDLGRARNVFERALEVLPEESREPSLFIEFAKFEVRRGEIERARAIYQLALSLFPQSTSQGLYHSYGQFEKQHGDTKSIEQVVLTKRRALYESQLHDKPHDYDLWFEYVRMEEEFGDVDMIREVYERAIAQVPPIKEKRYWRRYIFLWLYYASFEELFVEDDERALAIYKAALEIVPHERFTFAKLWTALAHFYVRQHNIGAARKCFGQALGRCPKAALFTAYIDLELTLREFDRVRKVYEKFLEWSPERSSTWIKFAELEALLGDEERARAIFELAISQDEDDFAGGASMPIDMPELIWKAYIDFEFEEGNYEAARHLYRRLLSKTDHIKVWVSLATFETSIPAADSNEGMIRARAVLQEAHDLYKSTGQTAERLLLMEAWRELEAAHGTTESLAALTARLPRRVLRRRKLVDAWEEYYDYVFPDDDEEQQAKGSGHSKLLELAHKWKQAKTQH